MLVDRSAVQGRRIRRSLVVALLAVVALIGAGCEQYIVPSGEAPLRYRDDIFSTVAKTGAVTYRTAVTQQGATVNLQLDVYRPVGDTVTQRPLIVFVHGGGFSSGTRTSPEIVDEATVFARKGYVTASIDYRLTPGGCSAGGPTAECVTAIVQAREDAAGRGRVLPRRCSHLRHRQHQDRDRRLVCRCDHCRECGFQQHGRAVDRGAGWGLAVGRERHQLPQPR